MEGTSLTEWNFTRTRLMSGQIFVKGSCQNLTDLVVSCCPSMVKFRADLEKMRKNFLRLPP